MSDPLLGATMHLDIGNGRADALTIEAQEHTNLDGQVLLTVRCPDATLHVTGEKRELWQWLRQLAALVASVELRPPAEASS